MRIDLDSIVMLVAGISSYLIATRRRGARAGDPTYEHFMSRFAGPLKFMGLIVIAFVVLKIIVSAF